jgi:hypothetical protein
MGTVQAAPKGPLYLKPVAALALAVAGLVSCADLAVAKNTILHCHGYQPDDHHKLPDQIITLDTQNHVAVSIQLNGVQSKDVINAPIKTGKDVLQWSYDAVNMKYVFNSQNLRLRLFSDTMVLLGIFDCTTS